MNERLHRSSDDRMLGGVCAGIADYFGTDPSLVRVLYALAAIVSGIVPLLIVYVVLAIVLPEAPTLGAGRAPSGTNWSAWSGSPNAAGGWPADIGTGSAGESWADREARRADRARRQGSDVTLVLGACLVLVGLVFLVGPYLHIAWDLVWPVVVIGLGAVLVVGGMGRRR